MNIINLVKRFTSKHGKKRQVPTTKSSAFKGDRPSWDEVWMSMAETIAQRSYDPRHRVGAVIVSDDNAQVLALGYNGNYSGGPNEAESNEPGQSGMIHAEINALLKLDYNNPKRKVMYLTLSPCRQCAKCIINAGIDEVVYRDEYRDTSGFELLRKSGLTLKKFTPRPR